MATNHIAIAISRSTTRRTPRPTGDICAGDELRPSTAPQRRERQCSEQPGPQHAGAADRRDGEHPTRPDRADRELPEGDDPDRQLTEHDHPAGELTDGDDARGALTDRDHAGRELTDGDEADRLHPDVEHPHARTVLIRMRAARVRQACASGGDRHGAVNATDSNSP